MCHSVAQCVKLWHVREQGATALAYCKWQVGLLSRYNYKAALVHGVHVVFCFLLAVDIFLTSYPMQLLALQDFKIIFYPQNIATLQYCFHWRHIDAINKQR